MYKRTSCICIVGNIYKYFIKIILKIEINPECMKEMYMNQLKKIKAMEYYAIVKTNKIQWHELILAIWN